MSKSVLISIQPKWVDKIICGKKTIEVRKTKPNLKTPFKCYIYCTKGKTELPVERKINREPEDLCDRYGILYWANGKVIGEFVCDDIKKFNIEELNRHNTLNYFLEKSQLSYLSLIDYVKTHQSIFYGWHISDLKIYDKPKELSDFWHYTKCNSCAVSGYESCACRYDEDCLIPKVITRPPQSWGYVEELKPLQNETVSGIIMSEIEKKEIEEIMNCPYGIKYETESKDFWKFCYNCQYLKETDKTLDAYYCKLEE